MTVQPVTPAPPPPAIAATDLAGGYRGRAVWKDGNFQIEQGELVAVLGPNGSGKSTLLKMLLGTLQPAAGYLEVLGGQPRRGNPAIGYVPQEHPIDPETALRGVDLVGFGIDGHRWGAPLSTRHRRRKRELVMNALQVVDALEFADKPIGQVSGGERQRLVLAQALVSSPRLLLADEPLTSLDLPSQLSMARLIGDLARSQGLTVLLVAHDVNPLLPVIDRVLYLARGQVCIGAPEEVIRPEALSRLYDTEVEVLTDSRGRVFVVGLDEETAHPHPEVTGC